MAASTPQAKDIQKLQLDVALIAQEQHNQSRGLDELKVDVAKNQQDILARMDKFAYVPIKDYARDQTDLINRIKKLEDRADANDTLLNAGGLKIANALNSGVSKAIVGVLVVAIVVAIIYFGARLYPAVGGLPQ